MNSLPLSGHDVRTLSFFTVTEFRKFKAALAVLSRAGVNRDEAILILINSWHITRTAMDAKRYNKETAAR